MKIKRELPIKHVIAQYLTKEYGTELQLSNTNAYLLFIKDYLTADKEDRLIDIPDNMDAIRVNLSLNFSELYPSISKLPKFSKAMDKLFWADVMSWIAVSTLDTRNVSESIRQFYEAYEIDEDKYSIENFHRQLNRLGLRYQNKMKRGSKRPVFRCVTDDEGLEICKAFYISGKSARSLAKDYEVSEFSIRRIKDLFKKRLISASENIAHISHRIDKLDRINFNRHSLHARLS